MSELNRSFICPEPLVYTYNDKDTVLWVYEEGNCASPCPTLTYSHGEWEFLKVVVLILAIASLLATAAASMVLLADFSKLFMRAMFLFGFLVSSVISMAFLITNRHDEVVCNGEGHFVKRNPFCVFQSTTVVFLFLWVESWAVLLAADTYLHIVSKLSPEQMGILRKRYVVVTVVFCTCMTAIPLIGGNLGFDPYANLPFCLYLYSEEKWYFWLTLFSPFIVLNSICLIITLAGASRIHRIFVSANQFTSQRARSVDTFGTDGTCNSSHNTARNDQRTASNSPFRTSRLYYTGEDDDDDEEDYGGGGSENSSSIISSEQGYSSRDPQSGTTSSPISPRSAVSRNTPIHPGRELASSSASRNPLKEPLMSMDRSSILSGDGESNDGITSSPFHSAAPFTTGAGMDCQARRPYPSLPGTAGVGDRDSLVDSLNAPRESLRSSWGLPMSEQDDEAVVAAMRLTGTRTGGAEVGSMRSASRSTAIATSYHSRAGLPVDDSVSKRPASMPSGRQHSTGDSSTAGTIDGDSTAWRKRVTQNLLRRGTENLVLVKQSLRYNGRSILFVVVFCLTTMYIAPSLLYINAVKYDYYVDGTEDFAACLVQASFAAPVQTQHEVNRYAQSVCGEVPSVRAAKWQFFSTMMWAFGYGIVPAFIFGFSGTIMQRFLDKMASLMGWDLDDAPPKRGPDDGKSSLSAWESSQGESQSVQ